MTTSARRSLVFGVLCSLVGIALGIFVAQGAVGVGWEWFAVSAAAASFVCGAALWRVLPERLGHRRSAWGALAGGLAGVVSHYFTWYFQYLGANLCYWLTGGCTGALGEPPANLLVAASGAAGFSFFSLVAFGWLTLAIGGGLGLVFARATRPPAH